MSDVSRETGPDPLNPGPASWPAGSERLIPAERLPVAARYAGLLAGDGVVRGLIGPREVPRLWERHLLNCAAVAEAIPVGASVCDIGSGAGLPGLVLAIARPDLRVTLVEPLLRRTVFLEEVVQALELSEVTIFRGRAESHHGVQRYDVVTSRALAPLERLLQWSMPLVAPTGVLLAMKGSTAGAEIVAAEATIQRLGCAPADVVTLGDSPEREGLPTATVVRVVWEDPARVSSTLTSARASRGSIKSVPRRPGPGAGSTASRSATARPKAAVLPPQDPTERSARD